METIFENRCTYSFSKYLQMKNTMLRSILTTGYVIFAISLILFVLGIIKDYGMLRGIGIIGMIIFGFRSFISPMWLAYKDTARDKKVYKQPMQTLINFYDDHFLAVNAISGSKTSINYEDILSVKKAGSIYIISMEQNLVILVDKKGFTKGDRKEFPAFLREKCENAEVSL